MQISGVTEHPIVVTEHVVLSGIATRGARVQENGYLDLGGVLNGQLIVDEGGEARVGGTVNGSVVVHGRCDITGVVSGSIKAEPGSDVTVAAGAFIGQRVLSEQGVLVPMQSGRASFISDSSPRFRLESGGSFVSLDD